MKRDSEKEKDFFVESMATMSDNIRNQIISISETTHKSIDRTWVAFEICMKRTRADLDAYKKNGTLPKKRKRSE